MHTQRSSSSDLFNWIKSRFQSKPEAFLGDKNRYFYDAQTSSWRIDNSFGGDHSGKTAADFVTGPSGSGSSSSGGYSSLSSAYPSSSSFFGTAGTDKRKRY
jgi:hypothetical protein